MACSVVSSRVLGAALLLSLSACAAEETPIAYGPIPAVTAQAGASAGAPPPATKPATPVRVLYKNEWFGGVTLLGVDVEHHRATVRLDAQGPSRLLIDTIDLQTGKRVDRWEADEEHAKQATKQSGFVPFSDSFEQDLAHFGDLLRPLGPWHARAPLASPTFAVNARADRFLFGARSTDGSESDLLYLHDKGGASHRVDEGLVAAHSPVFGPSGDNYAFLGCQTSPCDYALFLGNADERRPRRIGGVLRAAPPMWTASGDAVLTLGQRGASRCLFKVPVGPTLPKPISCAEGLSDVTFTQDPEGRTVALSGVRGTPGKQTVDVRWLLVADGTVLATQSIDRAVGSSVVNASGLMALPMQRGAVAVVDLVTGVSTILPEEQGWFFGFEGARWVGDTLVLLRKIGSERAFEIVAIDVRTITHRDQPWL